MLNNANKRSLKQEAAKKRAKNAGDLEGESTRVKIVSVCELQDDCTEWKKTCTVKDADSFQAEMDNCVVKVSPCPQRQLPLFCSC